MLLYCILIGSCKGENERKSSIVIKNEKLLNPTKKRILCNLILKQKENAILILDGFSDSIEMKCIIDSVMTENEIIKCHVFRDEEAYQLFNKNMILSKEENIHLWNNYLGEFEINN